MAADHSNNLHKLLESVSVDLQNLNLSKLSLQSTLEKQLRELVGPQNDYHSRGNGCFSELKETFKELKTRVEWMKNVTKQLAELVATLREQTDSREDVNELISTAEQPREDGLGKDQMMEYFIKNTGVVELPSAIQRDLDEMKVVANELNRQPNNLGYMVLADQILKYLMNIIELVPGVQRDADEIKEAFTKLVTSFEWIENMVKQVEVQAGCFSGHQIHTRL